MNGYCIGIDLGGTAVKLGLIGKGGRVEDALQVPTVATDAKRIEDGILRAVKRLIAQNPKRKPHAVGIGIPGFVDGAAGVITFIPNIPALQNYSLTRNLSRSLKLPVFADNDANNAARGEFLFGSAKGVRDFVFITIGTGIGGGLFLNGDLYDGPRNYAGEVGHMTIVPGGRACGCGREGCWETYGSATAMIRSAKAAIEKGVPTSLARYYPDRLSAKTIAQEARRRDFVAAQAFDEALRYTGIALANLIHVLNPGVCIIGGGVSGAGKFLLDKIGRLTRMYCLPQFWETVEIRLARLGNQAGILGSAALAFMRTGH